MTDWGKVRNKYVNSSLSVTDISKHFGLSFHSVANHCRDEHWVELRQEHRNRVAQKMLEKTVERQTEKQADNNTRIQDIASSLLDAVGQATKELRIAELHQQKSEKDVQDLGGGNRHESSDTKEYIEHTTSVVDMKKVASIADALKKIIEINTLLGGDNIEDNKAFADLMQAIGGINEVK